jgi:uncharacterized OB-fold protein
MGDTVTESLPPPRVIPPINDRNRHFWTGGALGELRMLRCQDCRYWIHPPVLTCPNCQSTKVTPEATSGLGTVFTFTINRYPYNPAVPDPLVIAIVELDDQPDLRLATNIVRCDPEIVAIGMPVQVLFEQHEDTFFPVFEPRATVAKGATPT